VVTGDRVSRAGLYLRNKYMLSDLSLPTLTRQTSSIAEEFSRTERKLRDLLIFSANSLLLFDSVVLKSLPSRPLC
jgi:hypothetical protein